MSTAIKERPILFSGEMVRAILDGRKTQTRRVVKLDNAYHECGRHEIIEWRQQEEKWFGLHGWATVASLKCPYGQSGDRLWVRETFSYELARSLGPACRIAYKASWCNGDVPGWKPSIHMPRWASRITLEITGVRVEKLNEISEEDCYSEGCQPEFDSLTALQDFRKLWESINGEGSWRSNPWVWVIEFKVTDAAQTTARRE